MTRVEVNENENTLAYCSTETVMSVESFIVQAPGAIQGKERELW